MKAYHKLIAWQKAHQFILETYRITETFPQKERFGLTSQIRRAAVSVAANIVEGQAKQTKKDFANFLNIAQGSLAECEYYLELARDLRMITDIDYNKIEKLRYEVGALLAKLFAAIRQS